MSKSKRIYLLFVNVNDLKPAPWNPPNRVSDKVTKDLVRSMNENNYLNNYPITITKDNYIADGHRRWTVAKTLGIIHIPALVTPLPLNIAWATAQEGVHPLTGREHTTAQVLGLGVQLKNSVGKKYTYYSNKYGEELIKYTHENGKALSIIQLAERISRYIGWDDGEVPRVLKWIIENKMSGMAQLVIPQSYDKAKLQTRIENNEPITLYEG